MPRGWLSLSGRCEGASRGSTPPPLLQTNTQFSDQCEHKPTTHSLFYVGNRSSFSHCFVAAELAIEVLASLITLPVKEGEVSFFLACYRTTAEGVGGFGGGLGGRINRRMVPLRPFSSPLCALRILVVVRVPAHPPKPAVFRPVFFFLVFLSGQ